jgi:hypothetical protein
VEYLDKIDKIQVTKLGLIFIFVLIGGISMILMFSGMNSGDMRNMFQYMIIIILMSIFAIIVKYVGDIMLIVLKSRDQ